MRPSHSIQPLTAAFLVRLTSFSHRLQSLDTDMTTMQDLIHFQARSTDWSAEDTIPPVPALSLSLIALGACIARLGLCFRQKRRWSQLGICFMSTVLSLCIIGLVLSRRYSMYLLPG